ncbi:hypothetical protein CEXT_213801 [Caerostris extrusa]|uniref:Secreted protein n=1 Tax=Caerostris extrusa TaxID=172846 RepID=A0AAV4V536_CAEEX|nr:hypothetical protein CEXT_213801 [Caerostris extrusa]
MSYRRTACLVSGCCLEGNHHCSENRFLAHFLSPPSRDALILFARSSSSFVRPCKPLVVRASAWADPRYIDLLSPVWGTGRQGVWRQSDFCGLAAPL